MATIPVGLISFLEYYFYRTNIFFSAVRDRALGWVAPIDVSTGHHIGSNQPVHEQGMIYNYSHTLLSLPAFWYGLAVAAIMVAGAVYIRRYRDES